MSSAPIEQQLRDLFIDQEELLDTLNHDVVDPLEPDLRRIGPPTSRGRAAFLAAAAAVVFVVGAAFVTLSDSSDPTSPAQVAEANPFQALDGARTPGAFAVVGDNVVFGSTSKGGLSGEEIDIYRVNPSTGETLETRSEFGGVLTSITASADRIVAVTSDGEWFVWLAEDFGDEDLGSSNKYGSLATERVAEGGGQFWIQFDDGSFIEYIPNRPDVGELLIGPVGTIDFVVTGQGDPFAATPDGKIYLRGQLVADLGTEVFGLVATSEGVVAVTADGSDGELKYIDSAGNTDGVAFSLTDAGTPIAWAEHPDDGVVVVYDSGRVGIVRPKGVPSGSIETFTEVIAGVPPRPSAAAVLRSGDQTVLIVAGPDGVLSTHLLPST